jgi:predicted transcriptional regulator
MSDGKGISAEVRELLQERVQSIEALEALLLLFREPERNFPDSEVASAIGIDVELVRAALEALEREGLVGRFPGSPPTFRYQPANQRLGELVVQLAATYAAQRVDVLVMIANSAMGRVRKSALHTFSEAFRLRGPKKNG